MTQGIRKNRMFLAGSPLHDALAALPARSATSPPTVAVLGTLGVDEALLARMIGGTIRVRSVETDPLEGADTRLAARRALLAEASAVISSEPETVLEAAVAGVPSVAAVWGPGALRWRLPVAAFVRSLAGCFVCADPSALTARAGDAIAFARHPSLVAALRRHAVGAAYTDGFSVGERVLDAVDAIVKGAAGTRHHYLRDPVLDVESKENVVGAILPETTAVAYRYFDPTMIDSEEA